MFDPKRKDAAIKLYLSRLEDKILSLDYKVGYSNLTMSERDVVYLLKNNNTIIIKEADVYAAVVWDREDHQTNSMIKMFVKNLQEMQRSF